MAAHIGAVQNSRLKTMVVPREHGAWGMMLVPLVTGAVVALRAGVNPGPLALFIVSAMSLFWLRTPVESWLGTSAIKAHTGVERGLVLRMILGIGSLAALCISGLLWNGHNRGLLVIGAVAAVAFTAQAAAKRLGRRGRMPAQMIGAMGLTSTAAGAYYVATGRLDRTAIALWLANWLFAGDQIHFVQLRIRCSRAGTFDEKLRQGLPFLFGHIALLGTLLAASCFGFFPVAVPLAFLPVLFRGILWFVRGHRPLDVHRLGFSELGHAIGFGAVLCAAFLL
ncbi:MAG TPA: YwiC-like family protein [Candidatus Binatia bacterium]|nr:YwiC-like family protein [Candidatus Binatia bacterium]